LLSACRIHDIRHKTIVEICQNIQPLYMLTKNPLILKSSLLLRVYSVFFSCWWWCKCSASATLCNIDRWSSWSFTSSMVTGPYSWAVTWVCLCSELCGSDWGWWWRPQWYNERTNERMIVYCSSSATSSASPVATSASPSAFLSEYTNVNPHRPQVYRS